MSICLFSNSFINRQLPNVSKTLALFHENCDQEHFKYISVSSIKLLHLYQIHALFINSYLLQTSQQISEYDVETSVNITYKESLLLILLACSTNNDSQL